jgi:transmembrane sensor
MALHRNAKELIEKYNRGEATEAEKALVETWYLQYHDQNEQIDFEQAEKDRAESLDRLLIQLSPAKKIWPRIGVAASVLLAVAAMLLIKFHPNTSKQVAFHKNVLHEITPGGNKAILTLSNGQRIVLSQSQNGTIASQGNMLIKKTGAGMIVYNVANGNASAQSNLMNTATTPRGGQFVFVLSDGTRVWLNAASSIKYPVVFNGNERRVELTGEAYFEVAHNAAMPFRVVAHGQVVEDLGTHFNINAYADEPDVKTTLIEGKVKISAAGRSAVLKPGQQSQVKDGNLAIVADADTDAAVAWKNGYFYFDNADIKTVMRQMARWYDADVHYEDNLPNRQFSGEIPRNINASQFLDILSFKKIHFVIEDKKITITH